MQNELTKIIYISWQSSYAMYLFKIRPVDFIIKPFTENRIFEVLDIAVKLIDYESGYFIYKCSGEHGILKLMDIMYFISSNRKITMHTLDEKIEYAMLTMNDDKVLSIIQKYRVDIRNRQREMLE